MGRTKQTKRNETATERTASNEQSYINDDTTADELEERIRKIEAGQASSGFSDVFKFTFFFLMGIALTLAVYPNIARTVESGSNAAERAVPLTKTNDRVYVNEYDSDSNGTSRYPEETSSQETLHEQTDELSTKTADSERMPGNVKINPQKESVQKPKVNVDKVEKVVRGKKEDIMIGEESETNIEIEDELSAQKNTDQATERVELLSINSEDINKMTDDNKNTDKHKKKGTAGTDKNKPVAKDRKKDTVKTEKPQTSKLKGPSSKKSKASKGKQKAKTNNQQNLSDDDKESEIPEEVRNFKPTFQKGVMPKKIFADGRRIPPMELLPQKPNNSSVKVWLFEEFLSEEECDGLMRVQKKHIEDQLKDDPILCFDTISTLRKHLKNVGRTVIVTPRDFTEGTTCVNASFSTQLKEWFNGNWSYSTAFYPGESRFATAFEQRVKQATGLLPENGGKFQITSYPEGIGYKTHTDCTQSSDKRDRVATILVYLDTVTDGGETEFPELGIWVRPRKARALVWNNMNEDGVCEPMSVHKAAKVGKGQHKYILQRWYYYQSFYSLGKRPPEPPIPARKPNQARVSCDEYENGSCRWYDEWNFDHMLDYQTRKYTLI